MPKAGKASKLNRVARRVATAAPLPTVSPPSNQDANEASRQVHPIKPFTLTSSQNLSRGQRKRLAKREQFLKKEQMILSTLKLQKQDEQRRQNGYQLCKL